GPGTKLLDRLERGDKGINLLDQACKNHDLEYWKHTDLEKRHEADKVLIEKARERWKAKDSTFGEKAAAGVVLGLMKAKVKLGMGIKRKRVIKAPKIGGFLPFLLPLLGALGALGGGAASIASAVTKSQSEKKMLEETERHNKAMEAAKKGAGIKRRKRKSKRKGKGLYVGHYKWYQKNR